MSKLLSNHTDAAPGRAAPLTGAIKWHTLVQITLNGDRFELDRPMTVGQLLSWLEIDPRRVAVEHNLIVVRRAAFNETLVSEGDHVEIVNFVGGG
jgi:thiamine biosynthesis protein ThiS